MSVQSPIYILWGLMLPYPKSAETDDDALYDRCEPYTDSAFDKAPKEGVTILFDGMGGKYVAVGHVIARSGAYGDDLGTHTIPLPPIAMVSQDVGLAPTPEQIMSYARWKEEIETALTETGLLDAAQGKPLGWHVIQHYR